VVRNKAEVSTWITCLPKHGLTHDGCVIQWTLDDKLY